MADPWEQCAAFQLAADFERKGVRKVTVGVLGRDEDHGTPPPSHGHAAAVATTQKWKQPFTTTGKFQATIPDYVCNTLMRELSASGVQSEGMGFSYCVSVIFAFLHKCSGNDAILAIDGVPPRALLNPFTGAAGSFSAGPDAMLDTPFYNIVKDVAETLYVNDIPDSETNGRQKLLGRVVEDLDDFNRVLEIKSKESHRGQKINADGVPNPPQVIGFAAVVFKRTLDRCGGPERLLGAFDVLFVFNYLGSKNHHAWTLDIVYNRSVYLPFSVHNWLDVIVQVEKEVRIGTGMRTMHHVDPLSPEMKHRLMSEWQPKEIVTPEEIERTLDQIFEETVETKMHHQKEGHPEGDCLKTIAVIEPKTERQIPYHQMSERSTKLAVYLRRFLGPSVIPRWGKDATCGIYVPRCADWYVLMVAIHKAGGAYLSLDPDFPPDRLSFALEDSSAVVLFTLPSMNGTLSFPGPTILLTNEFWAEIDRIGSSIEDTTVTSTTRSPYVIPFLGTETGEGGEAESRQEDITNLNDDSKLLQWSHTSFPKRLVLRKRYAEARTPCYLIYTSGSTGKPKGVLIEHKNAVNFVMSERRMYNLENHHRVLQGFSTSFDASVEELWLTFASGSTILVVEKSTLSDPEMLGNLVSKYQATVFSTVPTLLATMDPKQFSSLKIVITGGEACNREVIQTYARDGRKFVNSYGPTEATVACMWEVCDPHKPVTIGRAQPGFFAAIINERKEIVPAGVPGELVIAGPSVARGYVNRPELTEEKFVPCPYFPHDPNYSRMYHTGDLTRWNSEGKVEFLGRIDTQVKLRGFRIEVGEIETNLAAYPGVTSAVVHLRNDDGNPYLCAYILPTKELEAEFEEGKFKEFLKGNLPHYMIPGRFCIIHVFPRSPAGKLDRKQLPPPPPAKNAASSEAPKVPPGTRMEKVVFKSWQRCFSPSHVFGIDCNFFDIGGHSLLAGKLASEIRRLGGPLADVNIRTIYNFPTIRGLSAELERITTQKSLPTVSTLPSRFQPSLFRSICFGAWQLVAFHITLIVQWSYLVIFLALYLHLEETLGWSILYGWPLTIFMFGILFQCVGLSVFFTWNFFLFPIVKRILFPCGVQEGTHSIWSFYFLRWWTMRALGNAMPMILYQGTWIYNLHLRLCGMSLGRRAQLLTRIVDYDLVSIGADTYIGDNVVFASSEVIDSILHLRKITVGQSSAIWARSTLRGGCLVGSESIVRHLSLVKENSSVPDGECWGGSPAVRLGVAPSLHDWLMWHNGRDNAPGTFFPLTRFNETTSSAAASGSNITVEPTEANSASVSLLGAACIRPNICAEATANVCQFFFLVLSGVLLANPAGMMFFAAWIGFDLLQAAHILYYAALLVPIAPFLTLLVLLYQHLTICLFRWIMFPWKPKPGAYGSNGLMWHQKILIDTLARFSLMFAHQMYGTMFTQYFLKMMGCKVGTRMECSNLYSWTPGLTTFGNETFVADFVGVNPPATFRGVMSLTKMEIKDRAFVGNGAVIPGGITIGSKALVGLSSVPEKDVEEGSTVIGSPAFTIPRKTSADSVDQAATFRPTQWMIVRRVIWETFRCIMPACFISYSGLCAFLAILPLTNANDTRHHVEDVHFVELLNMYVWVVACANVIFVILIKWVVVGRHQPEEHPLWSPGVWRSEFTVDVITVVALSGVINLFRGSVYLPWLFRLLGSKIGKHCYLDTIFLTEPDMIRLGDGVCINDNVTLQTHLFEDRVMKMDYMSLDNRCSVGHYGIVLYNTDVQQGCTIAPLSLVMKGESYPAFTHWEGIPAQRRAPPEVMMLGIEVNQAAGINMPPPSMAPDSKAAPGSKRLPSNKAGGLPTGQHHAAAESDAAAAGTFAAHNQVILTQVADTVDGWTDLKAWILDDGHFGDDDDDHRGNTIGGPMSAAVGINSEPRAPASRHAIASPPSGTSMREHK